MAEGFGKKHLGGEWDVKSAGIEAHGVNPLAVKAMDEVEVDITNQESNLIDKEILHNATFVVTLCVDARDHCPTIPEHVTRDHWGFDDPAKAEGTEGEIRKVFQRVRDQIEEKIIQFKNMSK